MPRAVLDEQRIHPAIRSVVAGHHADAIAEVEAAVAAHPVVVLGMAGNPWPKKARAALDRLGIAHHDINHGSYVSGWRRRNAVKMWCGWPTFPIIFVRGQMVGGAQDLQRLIDSGELKRLLG
ncbi:MAG: glutaredoxin [Burkholderiales bacterium PBB6]|uniref:Glutaredoxin n=1 Tax=Ideonella margarita TaxID=2984191 RepID=A0ABU9C4G7_9BURK|nr:MAG: glutaredoxin [Burkholderiales bacterium PBB6]